MQLPIKEAKEPLYLGFAQVNQFMLRETVKALIEKVGKK